MRTSKRQQLDQTPPPLDFVEDFTDEYGHSWRVGISTKMRNGRDEISAISIWPKKYSKPLTRRLLKEIPLDELFRKLLAEEASHIKRLSKSKVANESHRGQRLTDDELQLVAKVYLAAFRARKPVQEAVASVCGISKSAAGTRIMAARSRGFITSTKGDDNE